MAGVGERQDLGLSVWRVHAGSGWMNGDAEVNGVGGGLETSPTAQTVAGGGWGAGQRGGGWGGEKSPKAQAQSGPQSCSLLLFVPLSPPHSPPNTLAHGLSRCSHSGRWRQTEGAWSAGTTGHAALRPPQWCEQEAETRSALSKARRPRPCPAPVALLGARWPARAGTPGAAGKKIEQSRPRTGPGERPEQERNPKSQAAGRLADLGGLERGRERTGGSRAARGEQGEQSSATGPARRR